MNGIVSFLCRQRYLEFRYLERNSKHYICVTCDFVVLSLLLQENLIQTATQGGDMLISRDRTRNRF